MRRVRSLRVNGAERSVDVDPDRTLLGVLRDDLELTGAKYGCGEGRCGACTVLIDDRPARSCLVRAGAVEGKAITTIEGLEGPDGRLHPVQQAFLDADAFQCGYCTPGQICSAQGLLNEGKARTEDEIRELMSGNLCRCGAYVGILAAVKEVVDAKR